MNCNCNFKHIEGFNQILADKIAKKGNYCCYFKFNKIIIREEVKQLCCVYDNENLFFRLYNEDNGFFAKLAVSFLGGDNLTNIININHEDNYMELCCKYNAVNIFKKLISKKKYNILKIFNYILDNNALDCLEIITPLILHNTENNFVQFRMVDYKISKYCNFYQQMHLANILKNREIKINEMNYNLDVSDLVIIAAKFKRWNSIRLFWPMITSISLKEKIIESGFKN